MSLQKNLHNLAMALLCHIFTSIARYTGGKGLIAADVWDWEAKRGNEKINTAS